MRRQRQQSTVVGRAALVVVCTFFAAAVAACSSMGASTSAYAWLGDAGRLSDAPASVSTAFSRVNSLCSSSAFSAQSCNPDDPSSCGGDAGGGARCAVVENAPVCLAAGSKTIGKTCSESGECAAGMACAYAEGGSAATCRPTCCVDACVGASDAGAVGSLYCTLAVEARGTAWLDGGVRSSERLPVCVAPQPCVYGGSASCGTARTCAPVGGGVTSCVDLGPRKAGESCAREACDGGNACVGQGGERTCLALCSQRNPRCAAGERCVRSVVVSEDLDVGYCIDPNVDRPRLF